jgi:RNA polymerase sigma factor for flagellar operon FliA
MTLRSSPAPHHASPADPADLPLYRGIDLADVVLVNSAALAAEARRRLLAADVVGFDTESKPTFRKGEKSHGPHLVQLAIDDRVFLYQTGQPPLVEGLQEVLEATTTLKVGFGLDSDVARLRSRLGISIRQVLDLGHALREGDRRGALGAKSAVEQVFGMRLQKSKSTTTSNWANAQLSERQMLYAANDAHVALRIYREWKRRQDARAAEIAALGKA